MTTLLRHIRTNAVACLALFVALTGTSYAGVHLAKGSVTTKALAKNAVTSAKIKNGSVKVAHLAPGAVPQDADMFVTHTGPDRTPAAVPDNPSMDWYNIQFERSGLVEVSYFVSGLGVSCSSGVGELGLYVDGQPVQDSAVVTGSSADPQTTLATDLVEIPAGTHRFDAGLDCPDGTMGMAQWASATWTISLLAQ